MYIQNITELIEWKRFGVATTIAIQSWRQIRSEKKFTKTNVYCLSLHSLTLVDYLGSDVDNF